MTNACGSGSEMATRSGSAEGGSASGLGSCPGDLLEVDGFRGLEVGMTTRQVTDPGPGRLGVAIRPRGNPAHQVYAHQTVYGHESEEDGAAIQSEIIAPLGGSLVSGVYDCRTFQEGALSPSTGGQRGAVSGFRAPTLASGVDPHLATFVDFSLLRSASVDEPESACSVLGPGRRSRLTVLPIATSAASAASAAVTGDSGVERLTDHPKTGARTDEVGFAPKEHHLPGRHKSVESLTPSLIEPPVSFRTAPADAPVPAGLDSNQTPASSVSSSSSSTSSASSSSSSSPASSGLSVTEEVRRLDRLPHRNNQEPPDGREELPSSAVVKTTHLRLVSADIEMLPTPPQMPPLRHHMTAA
ncbi:unnamed protein product [Protopolystoma xenopodis]|uniref:Uncharacterized protein n=1 Tax=Protopolystoma xenopodis TaxID=117903 RepID=A0A448XID2_9PLAT|nr:unnamed protein product [Protopolystoma xenopodis]